MYVNEKQKMIRNLKYEICINIYLDGKHWYLRLQKYNKNPNRDHRRHFRYIYF